MLSYLETKQLFEEDVITRTGTLLCFGKGQSSASACSLRLPVLTVWVGFAKENEANAINRSPCPLAGLNPFHAWASPSFFSF
mmetsp:Transcript_16877/g.30231  ORF Transcript_16877/g.30231 Transcript_16877/m.30231 type:complete len:82 (+) Transcript_16877:611-856(+)